MAYVCTNYQLSLLLSPSLYSSHYFIAVCENENSIYPIKLQSDGCQCMEYVNTQGKSTTVLAYYLNPGLHERTGELGSVRQCCQGELQVKILDVNIVNTACGLSDNTQYPPKSRAPPVSVGQLRDCDVHVRLDTTDTFQRIENLLQKVWNISILTRTRLYLSSPWRIEASDFRLPNLYSVGEIS